MAKELRLIPHDGVKYVGQTVMLSGHQFTNCVFEGCTLMVTNQPFATKNVEYNQCNVHLQMDLLWGAPDSITNLRRLLDLFSGKTPAPIDNPAVQIQ
jgi:hypothetical protein